MENKQTNKAKDEIDETKSWFQRLSVKLTDQE